MRWGRCPNCLQFALKRIIGPGKTLAGDTNEEKRTEITHLLATCPEIEAPDYTDKEAMEAFYTTIKQKITTIQEQTSIGENPQMA